MTEKGKIFKGYAENIIRVHGFGSNKMVHYGPDMFCSLDTVKACEVRKELIAEGYLRAYNTTQTISHGSKGFRRSSGCPINWTGLTEKGWAIANKYLNA